MAEITTTSVNTNSDLSKWAWIFAFGLAVFMYFFGLWVPFLGPDEPRYAQVAREMFERGDWVTTTLGGFNWFEKPALLYWAEIASFNLFGVSEFAARIAPAMFGLGTVFSLWVFGRRTVSAEFAKWLALIAASTLGIFVFSRGASFDITITFPLTAAMVSFFVFDTRLRRDGKVNYLAIVLFYVFIGIALLAKGLIGIVFPFAIVAFYFLLSRRFPSRFFILSLFWGTLIATAVAALWYLPMYLQHGWNFIDQFFVQHHFQRYTSNKYKHPQPFYFFFWVLPLMTLPWMPFFFASLWKLIKGLFRNENDASADASHIPELGPTPLVLFAVSWITVPLVFFSFSGSKLPGYILPAVPGAIVLTSIFLSRLVSHNRTWKRIIYSMACLVFIVTGILVVTVLPKFADMDSTKGLIADANARGYAAERVFSYHTLSHSSEFYAAGRLLRNPDGTQKKLFSPAEIETEIRRGSLERALVLFPLKYQNELENYQTLNTEIIRDNGALVIAVVSLR